MEVKILDNTGRQLSREQLQQMNLWNDTLAHVCASALERLQQADITGLSAVEADPGPC